jgi:fermentation-respiration switch protein FrsA (DUF1100 family)
MALLIKLAAAAALLYAVAVGALWYFQRALLYPGASRSSAAMVARVAAEEPARFGLPGFAQATITTADGERLNAWWRAPDPGRPAILFLHGNGGDIAGRVSRARILTEDGAGLLLLSWRGYPGSAGSPSEAGLIEDGRAALAWIRAAAPGAPIVLYGESLGSGVAVRLATEPGIAGVILDAPYAAIVDLAAKLYWWVPVRLLLNDQFRSIDHVGQLRAPLLVLHGDRDAVTPITEGERLFAAAPQPKRFVRIGGGPHMGNLEDPGGEAAVRAFLAELSKPD